MRTAIYPGSFDPFHPGHLNVVKKALTIFDHLYVIVSINPDKVNQTPIEDRVRDVENNLSGIKNVTIMSNTNKFVAEIAQELKVEYIVRSARNSTDYAYELELAAGNKHLNNKLETILILPDYDFINYSSTLERHKRKMGK